MQSGLTTMFPDILRLAYFHRSNQLSVYYGLIHHCGEETQIYTSISLCLPLILIHIIIIIIIIIPSSSQSSIW
jgi:hypothetical protein